MLLQSPLKPLINVWHDTRYAAALWGVEQMTLAGAMPHDIWPIAHWYAIYVTGALDAVVMLWRDVTGELIGPP